MVEALTWSAAVFTAGGLLLLERRCLGQIAVVQPLVLCLVCGWITGTEEIAIWLGISVQLLSVGQGHNADWALAGVICAAGILLQEKLQIPIQAGSPHSLVLITAAVIFAMAARRFDQYLARTDCAKQRAAPLWDKPNLPKAFERLIHGRIRRGFLVGGVQSLVGVGASMFLVIGMDKTPIEFSAFFEEIAAVGVPTLGGAITLGSLSGYRFVGYAAAGVAAALAAVVLSRKAAIRKWELLRVSLRMAFIQSSWSEGGMQSEALAYCLTPALRRVYSADKELGDALRRYRSPFNTHPYLAGMIAGAVLKMEQEGASPKRISSMIRGTMGPLAAMGDPFFKGAMSAAAAAMGCTVALLAGPIWGAATLLLAFNLVHLLVRISSVFTGYREGEMALASLATWIGPPRTRVLKAVAASLMGIVLVLLVMEFGGRNTIAEGIFTGLACIAGLFLTKRRSAWGYATPVLLVMFLALELLL